MHLPKPLKVWMNSTLPKKNVKNLVQRKKYIEKIEQRRVKIFHQRSIKLFRRNKMIQKILLVAL